MVVDEATTQKWLCWSWCGTRPTDTRRYRAVVEYDGTEFCGFQRQAQGERTVQETLETAIRAVTGLHAAVLGAGRTDSGVHAVGQVIAFDVSWRHDPDALGRALNANLPSDVAVRKVEGVSADFHPRFDATRRIYEYTINNQSDASPLLRRTTWHRAQPLSLSLMQEASDALMGEHDFATFGRPSSGDNSVRCIFRADWRRDGMLMRFVVEANGFLQRMVRSLVGSLCLVGEERWSVATFAEVFAAADRGAAGPTAPPQGLCLLEVVY